MLPQKNKLIRISFNDTWKEGRRIHTPFFTFVYKKSPDHGHFSCVVSKKISKKAIDRNKIRRLVYRIVDSANGRNLPISGIFVLKPEIKKTSKEEVSENIIKTLKSI